MRVKICGITKPEQGQAIAQMGATALGFICVPSSPRYVTPGQISLAIARLPTKTVQGDPLACIGVFASAELPIIHQTVESTGLTGVQLHGEESPEFCQKLRAVLPDIELIKAIRVRDRTALQQLERYADCVDTFLLDAYHPHLLGGTGQALDWSLLSDEFQPPRPWLLAGGLSPENIQTALQKTTPDGIDLSSGVERTPGDKDLELVALLFQQLAPYLN